MSFLSSKIFNVSQLLPLQNSLNRLVLTPSVNGIQIRNYAARKGTRERREKKKVKVAVQKVGFVPHNLRNREKMLAARPSRKFSDSWKRDPIDNVYPMKYYKWKVYPFEDAIKAHRETHHPEMYNRPDAEVFVTVELNMQGEKKTRFVDNFKRIVAVPHKYDHGEDRSTVAFAKNEISRNEALEAGAHLVGGVDLIKQIQNGQVLLQDFQHIIAHPDIMPELVSLRGIMKKKFPSQKLGTLDPNFGQLVERLLNGVGYQALKDEYEKDFGQIDVLLGFLNMDAKHLEENFASFINDVYTQKPKREGDFITRCLIWSPPSREKLKVDHNLYLVEENTETKDDVQVETERVAL